MKKSIPFIFSLALLLMVSSASCSPKESSNTRPVLRHILSQEDVRAYVLPGFLVRYAMLVTEETRQIRPALRGVSSFTLSITENLRDAKNVFTRLNLKLKAANYCNYMEVIDSDGKITIKALERDGHIREIVIIVNDNESLVCIGLRGDIDPENLLLLVSNFAQDSKSIKV